MTQDMLVEVIAKNYSKSRMERLGREFGFAINVNNTHSEIAKSIVDWCVAKDDGNADTGAKYAVLSSIVTRSLGY